MNCELKKINGTMCICIDGNAYAPLAFKTFRPTKTNITDFYHAGIRLFNILTTGIASSIGIPYSPYGESWIDDETYDFSVIDRQIDLFMEHAPEAYFSLMIQLDTREWWLKKYAGYPDSFLRMAQMEAEPYWREMAAKYMQAVISHVEEKYKDKFYGYFLLGGTTTEWFSENSYEAPTSLVETGYRKWCGSDHVCVPPREVRETEESIVFLDCEKDENLINYRKFQNWQRSDTILYFAAKAQEILQHKRLLGIYFGYIFELDGSRLWNTGHLDYERVFLSDDIDMISSPMSYASRAQNCGSHQMITSGTLTANNKLYFLEHDHTTSIISDYIEGHYFVHPNKAKTVEEDVNLLRRDYMLAAANGCAMWWFDMFEGWFYHEQFMEEITNMISISEKLLAVGYRSVSEIAVIVDPESMYYVNKNSGLNSILFNDQRQELAYIGAPYEIISSCDVDKIDLNQYKLFIFLDQLKKNEKVDAFIRKLKDNGKTLLFVYAYNIIDQKYDISCMSRDLGINLKENPLPEDTFMLTDTSLLKESEMDHRVGAKTCAERSCFAIDDDVTVLGYYKNSGEPAFGYKRERACITAFAGLGSLTAPALREIMTLSGVYKYTTSSDAVIYVNNVMLGVYHRNQTDIEIHLPQDEVYVDLYNGNREYTSHNGLLRLSYDNCRAKFLVKKNMVV